MNWEDFVSKVAIFEGCPNKNGICYAYRDKGGTITIGYGFTQVEYIRRKDLSVTEAKSILNKTLTLLYNDVRSYMSDLNYNLTKEQELSLTDFTFNLGFGNLKKLTANGTRSIDVISSKILEYNKCNGEVLAGLVERRQWEYDLFVGQKNQTFVKKTNALDLQIDINSIIKRENLHITPLILDGVIGEKTIDALYQIANFYNIH